MGKFGHRPPRARAAPEGPTPSPVLGCNLKNDRMISVCFQGKPFNIMVIQAYAPTSSAKEAEVEWFYEDLQDVLESESPSVMSDSVRPHGLYNPWNSPGHAGKEGPQLARTGAPQGFPRAAAPVGVFSRGTTRISGSLSCGAREVRSPCACLPIGGAGSIFVSGGLLTR